MVTVFSALVALPGITNSVPASSANRKIRAARLSLAFMTGYPERLSSVTFCPWFHRGSAHSAPVEASARGHVPAAWQIQRTMSPHFFPVTASRSLAVTGRFA